MLQKLEYLNLSDNDFNKIPRAIGLPFSTSPSLQNQTNRNHKPLIVAHLKLLIHCDLGNNLIKSVGLIENEKSFVRHLTLSFNENLDLFGFSKAFPHLQELDISHCKLEVLPEEIGLFAQSI